MAVLTVEDRSALEAYMASQTNPFSVPIPFRLLDVKEYGLSSPVIVGADTYLAAKVEKVPNFEIAYGYSFEKVCLFALSRGIGTVMLAASLSRTAFEKAMAIPVAKSYGLTVITNGNGASEERVRRLGADRFIDYKKEDYAKVLSNVDYVLDTLGDRELEKEFSILKDGGSLVSLRGMPNGEFAARTGMSMIKRLLLKVAGRKYDQMAARRNQKYYFIFVHEDGAALGHVSEIFGQNHLEASVDGVYTLDDVNEALKKVASGGSKGKTILKISE